LAPHEHAKMLEEMYVYFDMPEPAYGIQLVYNNTEYPELVTVVRDGDAVLMPGAITRTLPFQATALHSSGRWQLIAKWRTGSLVS
jgi:hypothetical protein